MFVATVCCLLVVFVDSFAGFVSRDRVTDSFDVFLGFVLVLYYKETLGGNEFGRVCLGYVFC